MSKPKKHMPVQTKQKKVKKKIFIQDFGTYSNEVLVVVGMKPSEIIRRMKRLHIKKDFIEVFSKEKSLHDTWLVPAHNGATWINEGRVVIWFREWEDDWVHYETLIHEIYHAVYGTLLKSKHMWNEEEAIAYQLEYLFRHIRRKLNENK